MRNAVVFLIAMMVLAAPAWALRPNPDWNPGGNDLLLWHMDNPTGTTWTDTAWGSMNGAGAGTSKPGLFADPALGGLGAALCPDAGIVSPNFASARGHEFTAECWVYWPTGTNPQAANQLLFDRRTPTNMWYAKANVMTTGGVADTIEFAAWVAGGTGGAVNTGPCNFVTNQWYHIAITCQHIDVNNNTIRIYVTPAPAPGVPIIAPVLKVEKTGYGDMPATTGTPLRVGGGATGGMVGRNFDANIDEVRLTGAVLTSFDSFAPGISPRIAAVAWGSTQQFYFDTTATPVTWQVNDVFPAGVGSITADGLFTALQPGSCQVQATDSNSVTDIIDITVPYPVVAPDTAGPMAPDATQQFAFNTLALPVTWEIVNESTPGVGTLDSTGLFTAVAPGTCQIRATDAQFNTDDSGTVTVANTAITPSNAQVVRFYTAQFTAAPYNGALTWSVTDESGPVGSVGTIGPASGLFTAVGVGTCTVRVVDSTGNAAATSVAVVGPGACNYAADANTVALYHLDEATGTSWADSSGNNLTLNASYVATPPAHVPGLFGNAAGGFNWNEVPPTNRWMQSVTSTKFQNPEMTAECWVYFPADVDIPAATADGSIRGILSGRVSGNGWSLCAGSWPGVAPNPPYGVPGGICFVYWGATGSSSVFLASTTRVFYNEIWYHVAATYKPIDASNYDASIYVTPLGTTTPVLVANTVTVNKMAYTSYSGVLVGTEGGNNGRKLPGIIDEVRISNKVRTAGEMSWTLGGVSATPYGIGEAKRDVADGTTVALTGAICANLPGCSYLEDVNRSAGIKLDTKQTLGLAVGDLQTVVGKLATANNERYLQPLHAEKTAALVPALGPLGMNNRSTGGGTFGLQPGAAGGAGLNSFGQLVRIWGKWLASGTDARGAYFEIDDGSGVTGADGAKGVRVYYSGTVVPTGRNVAVTGVLIPVTDASSNVVRGMLPTAEIQLTD